MTNGAFGIIKEIIYPENPNPDTLPDAIIVYFKQYVGPQFFIDQPNKHNWIPINSKTTYSKYCQSSRTQYPLRLSYALTTYKVQGDTLESGVIDLGKTERNLGSSFVQLSRFKKIDQFLIKPFPFDRLTKIINCKQLAPRIKEEAKLNKYFENTKKTFSHLFTFN